MSSENLKEKIKQFSQEYLNDTITIRRHLHMHPELSFQEVKTSEYVWDQLSAIGVDNKQKMAGTGIVALIKGKNWSDMSNV